VTIRRLYYAPGPPAGGRVLSLRGPPGGRLPLLWRYWPLQVERKLHKDDGWHEGPPPQGMARLTVLPIIHDGALVPAVCDHLVRAVWSEKYPNEPPPLTTPRFTVKHVHIGGEGHAVVAEVYIGDGRGLIWEGHDGQVHAGEGRGILWRSDREIPALTALAERIRRADPTAGPLALAHVAVHILGGELFLEEVTP
jgi:hypothetical protein